jgi:hypothetical protein
VVAVTEVVVDVRVVVVVLAVMVVVVVVSTQLLQSTGHSRLSCDATATTGVSQNSAGNTHLSAGSAFPLQRSAGN